MTDRDNREALSSDKRAKALLLAGVDSSGHVRVVSIEEARFQGPGGGYDGLVLATHEQVQQLMRSGFATLVGGRASSNSTVPTTDQAEDAAAQRVLIDAMGRVWVHDPFYKAGQDPAGAIADGLSVRCRKGPSLDYIASPASPLAIPSNGSGDAIYGDTLDVTDANWLNVEVMFHLQAAGNVETENANLGIGLESSEDGFYWSPVPVVNRASLISPATMFRNDNGQTSGAPSTTGGFTDAANTQNAPLPEDVLALWPANRSATADANDPDVTQRVIPFYVAAYLYVRVVFVPIFSEPPDFLVPLLSARVHKAVGP